MRPKWSSGRASNKVVRHGVGGWISRHAVTEHTRKRAWDKRLRLGSHFAVEGSHFRSKLSDGCSECFPEREWSSWAEDEGTGALFSLFFCDLHDVSIVVQSNFSVQKKLKSHFFVAWFPLWPMNGISEDALSANVLKIEVSMLMWLMSQPWPPLQWPFNARRLPCFGSPRILFDAIHIGDPSLSPKRV